MDKLVQEIIGLYRKCATQLSEDVVGALQNSVKNEQNTAKNILEKIEENLSVAKNKCVPICQDTGTPIFFIKYDRKYSQKYLRKCVNGATKIATKEIPLRPNAVDIITEKNSGDNTGDNFPVIYFEEIEKGLVIELILKGGGSENIGMTYKLPDDNLGAERNLEGVYKCVLDAVIKAQGKGCPPYLIGVGVGGLKDVTSFIAKKQLLRTLDDKNNNGILDKLEKRLYTKINSLGIGPMGLGGNTTCLGVKIATGARNPPSYFVDVSFLCWVARRGKIQYE